MPISYTWTGAIDGNLDLPGNYSPSGLPVYANSDTLDIPASLTNYPTSGTSDASVVYVYPSAVINYGVFLGYLLNDGFIYDILYDGAPGEYVYNQFGTIYNGTFYSPVTNANEIYGGKFCSFVTNSGTIYGGDFNQTIEETGGTIVGGNFEVECEGGESFSSSSSTSTELYSHSTVSSVTSLSSTSHFCYNEIPFYPTLDTSHVKATSVSWGQEAYYACDHSKPVYGSTTAAVWQTANTSLQKFNIDVGVSIVLYKVYFENYSNFGTSGFEGVKNYELYGTNNTTAFNNTTYSDLTNLTLMRSGQFAEHSAVDQSEPQYITFPLNTTSYQYYVFRFADNWGGPAMGIRRIELFECDYPSDTSAGLSSDLSVTGSTFSDTSAGISTISDTSDGISTSEGISTTSGGISSTTYDTSYPTYTDSDVSDISTVSDVSDISTVSTTNLTTSDTTNLTTSDTTNPISEFSFPSESSEGESTSAQSSSTVTSESSWSTTSEQYIPDGGITYYNEFKDQNSINNPTEGNNVQMQFEGFWDNDWTQEGLEFDNFGYGLKKSRNSNGMIFCNDASSLFYMNKGYVGMTLSFPDKIVNGVYKPLINDNTDINEYILWGVNIGQYQYSQPCIYAALTSRGIEFTIWSAEAKVTILDNTSNFDANTNIYFEFVWGENYGEKGFESLGVAFLRINSTVVASEIMPFSSDSLSGAKFCVLNTPFSMSNLECIIRKLAIYNKIPPFIDRGSYFIDNFESENFDPNFVTYVNTVADDNGDLILGNVTNNQRFIWLPNSQTQSISKIDVSDPYNAHEVARYKTGGSGSNPSRTAIDALGNCWVGNRNNGTVVKMGNYELGQYENYVDNGRVNTSHYPDLPAGSPKGFYNWPDIRINYKVDECILKNIRVEDYATHNGVDTHKPWENNIPSSYSIRGIAVDLHGNTWVNGGTSTWFKIDENWYISHYTGLYSSYGCVCDKNGIIWSVVTGNTGLISWFDTNNPSRNGTINLTTSDYGITVSENYVYVGGWSYPAVARIDIETKAVTYFETNVTYDRGVVPVINNDGTEDLFVSIYTGIKSVLRIKDIGNTSWSGTVPYGAIEIITIPVSLGYSLAGLAITEDDLGAKYLWVLDHDSTVVSCISESTNTELFTVSLGESGHYNYNNFSGYNTFLGPALYGVFSLVFEGEDIHTVWARFNASLSVPYDSGVSIRASVSDDNVIYSSPVPAMNNKDLNMVGKYLKLLFTIRRKSSVQNPMIKNIYVEYFNYNL